MHDSDVFAQFGLGSEDRTAWQTSGRPDAEFDGWLIDRIARRPAGTRARAVYGAEDVHDFARRAILDSLHLRPGDRLLDIGCGGGLLLRDALRTGSAATGVDHSAEMVTLARTTAPDAEVLEGRAEHLPFDDAVFTAVAMSVVFFFLDEPTAALRECKRVVEPGGRLAIYTTGPQLRGTPAAPEPVATHGLFYEDEQLAALVREVGFTSVAVLDDGGASCCPREVLTDARMANTGNL